MMRSLLSRGRKEISRLTARRSQSSHQNFYEPGDGRVIYGLIGVNAVVFYGWHESQYNYGLQDFMNKNFLLSHNGVWVHSRFHTLVTAVFSHQSLMHFAGNMLTLYFFGPSTLVWLGSRQFLHLYFGSGIFSSLCAVTWPDLIPNSWPASWQMSRYAPSLGASGAVAGVVTWSILHNPRSVIMLYMVIPIPAALFGVLYIGNEVSGLYTGNTGTSNIAHLGGVIFGGLYYFRRFLRR